MNEAYNRYLRLIERISSRGIPVVVSHDVVSHAFDRLNPYRDCGIQLIKEMLSFKLNYHILITFFQNFYYYSTRKLRLNRKLIHYLTTLLLDYLPRDRIHLIDLNLQKNVLSLLEEEKLPLYAALSVSLSTILGTKYIISCDEVYDKADIIRLNPYPLSLKDLEERRETLS